MDILELKKRLEKEKNTLIINALKKDIAKIEQQEKAKEMQIAENDNSMTKIVSKTGIEYFKKSNNKYIVPSVFGATEFEHQELQEASKHGLDILKTTKQIKDLFNAKFIANRYEEQPKKLGERTNGI